MTVHELLAAIEAISDTERAAVLAATGVTETQTPIAGLSKKSRAILEAVADGRGSFRRTSE